MSWLKRKPAPNAGEEAYVALLKVFAQLGTDIERLGAAFDGASAAAAHIQSVLETIPSARAAGDSERADRAHLEAIKLLGVLRDALATGHKTMREGASMIRTAGGGRGSG